MEASLHGGLHLVVGVFLVSGWVMLFAQAMRACDSLGTRWRDRRVGTWLAILAGCVGYIVVGVFWPYWQPLTAIVAGVCVVGCSTAKIVWTVRDLP